MTFRYSGLVYQEDRKLQTRNLCGWRLRDCSRGDMASASSEDNEKAVENFEIDTLPDPIAVANEQEIIAAPNSHVDGGKRAWLQVIGSFLVFFNIWVNIP